jgi:DNA (cytosine-5)-methyltransferase 1
MISGNYYNENDPKKAAWLRELIKANVIAPGEVDERSIKEIRAEDLRGFSQCHFFAGSGAWSYALRLAGWPDDRPVWTGSCPCPSFSTAGKGKGFADPRHLWPHWASLIRECRPALVFGEQVASAIGHGWLDLVYVDLEASSYSVGAAVLGACSIGAPHIRQRLYFAGHRQHAASNGFSHRASEESVRAGGPATRTTEQRLGAARGSSDTESIGRARRTNDKDGRRRELAFGHSGETGDGDNSLSPRLEGHFGDVRDWRGPGWLDSLTARSITETGATRGFWADCDWWYGKDGKYRPIEPGVFPLAHVASNRVLKLRGYGDAICAPLTAEFIRATKEAINL